MAECPGGRTTRGTRSQFRLGIPGLGQCRGFYPIQFGDIMNAGQSSQTGILSSRNLSSPTKVNRTRTVREYEQTINELKTENFDLKLRLFMLEDSGKKNSHKDNNTPDQDPVEIIVKLNSESESLQNELSNKEKLLQDALEQAEKWELNYKELEKKCTELQSELSLLSELPSKEEYLSLVYEKENYLKHIETLEKELGEREQDIHDLNQKIEIISERNMELEEKNKKRGLAIQSFVHKSVKDKEMLPEELRNIVITATQAAKKRNKDELAVAMKSISSTLNKMMCSAVQLSLKKSEEKKNIKSPQAKCLKEEFLEKSSAFLPSQNEPCTELSNIQSLKEVLAERNTPETTQLISLDSFVHESHTRGPTLCASTVNIAERDIVDHETFPAVTSTTEENLISFSTKSSRSSLACEYNSVAIRNLSLDEIPVLDRGSEECQLIDVLKENKKLKLELKEKLGIIQDLQANYKEQDVREVHVQAQNDALKASNQHSVYTQTNIAGCNLFDEMTRLQKDAKLSSNVDELREDVLLLLLAIEDKNKELIDVKQSLSSVQEDLKKTLNTTNVLDKDYYMNERNELHERLAFSCSVNEELMRHLKNLERFMEDLLQNKFDSSIDSMSEKSDFICHVSKCLNESVKLSNVLSDHLSICEGSKLFEECESFLYKSGSYFDENSLPHFDTSQLSEQERYSLSYPGTHLHEGYIPFVSKNDMKISKESNSQLCWQYWQQLNAAVNKSDMSHQVQYGTVPKNYPSSESDVYSEPDRDLSMQRIGISLQNSPVASKSPQKSRLKEKRLSTKLSSDMDTSSSDSHRLSKKRHGSVSRRLFTKENIKNQDFTSEKFYFLLAEKYSKLKSLLDEFESIKDTKVSDDVWIKLNAIIASLGEALQKLHIARENAKNFPSAVCGKCVILELLTDLKAYHKESDFYIENSSLEQDILQQFLKEIRLLKETCKEPFSLFSESTDKKSQSIQSDTLSEHVKIKELEHVIIDLKEKNKELCNNLDDVKTELLNEKEKLELAKIENSEPPSLQNETFKEPLSLLSESVDKKSQSTQSDTLSEHIKINELEDIIIDLKEKNKELCNSLDDVKTELSKEKELLALVKIENSELSSQISSLRKELSNMKQKEKELCLENKELSEKLIQANESNSELSNTLRNLEEKSKESNVALDQLASELQMSKSDLVRMNKKCLEYERELDQQISKKKECENKLLALESTTLSEKKNYLSQIDDLNAEKNDYIKQLESVKEKRLALEKDNWNMKNELDSLNKELSELKYAVKDLQEAKETLNANYTEIQIALKNTEEEKTHIQNLLKSYEDETLAKLKEKESEYFEHLKQLEFKSLNEKEALMSKINVLTTEKRHIAENLQHNKECYEQLKKQMAEINQNYIESCEQITSLKLLNEELKNKQSSLLKKNKFFENALTSSNSECGVLNKDLKRMRETLQSLESKCLVYEKQLSAAASMKGTLIDCLLNVNNDFAVQRQKLNEMCKFYGIENDSLQDETSEIVPIVDENNVKKLSENLGSESKKLLQSIDMLLGLLKDFHLKSLESKIAVEKADVKTASIQSQKQIPNIEIEHLKSQNEQLQRVIKELQKSISEKEKSVQFSAYEIQSLKEKIYNTESEIEKGSQLLKQKDDEITTLQERIFDLQTYLSSIATDETILHAKTSSTEDKKVDCKIDFVSSNNQLPSQSASKVSKMCQTSSQEVPYQKADNSSSSMSSMKTSRNCCEKYEKENNSLLTKLDLYEKRIEILEKEKSDYTPKVSKMCQTSGHEEPYQKIDDSFTSTSSLETSRNSCCEKYQKKNRSLLAKLALYKKHIEVLEKDKNDLRESFLQQLQSKQDSLENKDSYDAKLVELESKLEKKKAFISELKGELLKTCNSLIDKDKQLNDLKLKLSEAEAKSKSSTLDMPNRHSITLKTVDENIKNLKSYKWRLIETIFDIQKSFYEKKGIHLNYFERFKDHVNNLHTMQLTQSLSKSESMPLLGSHTCKTKVNTDEDKVKCLVGLELDIECLENLKIFLNRFFVPSVLDMPQTLDDKAFMEEKQRQSESLSKLQAEVQNSKSLKHGATDILNISFPNISDYKDVPQEKLSFENFASSLLYHLDCIEKIFKAIKKYQWLESFDTSAQEYSNKAEIKSLLLKILQEIKVLHEGSDKMFNLISSLKKFGFALPRIISSSRPDVSDRESVMSEETIAVSRCESPLSFEDVCPIKLPCPEMLKLEEATLKPESLRNRAIVGETYNTKVATIGSSCDSVCQRSHYSSPDLGIESDPNHDSSAPEQKDDGVNKYQKQLLENQKFMKSLQKTAYTNTESAGRWSGHKFGETLYAIGNLPHYELLKKEITESLVAIKSVLSRTGDGLHHIAKYTSPRKTLEYSTLKSIKDTCIHIDVCLKAAHEQVGKFWTAYCPSEKQWKLLNDENQQLTEDLSKLRLMIQKQESEFKKAMGKLEHAQVAKANMERKISKKLVKTKNVIRQTELKVLQNRCQNFPLVPKYPSDQSEQLLPADPTQQS